MDPSSAMVSAFWLEILTDPGSVKLKEIWFGIMMVRCSGNQMEVWLDGQQRILTRAIRQLQGRVMCELGDLVSLTDGRLLSYAETKVAGSFLPRCLH